MSEVKDIEARIRNLPPDEFTVLRKWFHEFENTCWDEQIASDCKAGKFSKLIEKARTEYAQGRESIRGAQYGNEQQGTATNS